MARSWIFDFEKLFDLPMSLERCNAQSFPYLRKFLLRRRMDVARGYIRIRRLRRSPRSIAIPRASVLHPVSAILNRSAVRHRQLVRGSTVGHRSMRQCARTTVVTVDDSVAANLPCRGPFGLDVPVPMPVDVELNDAWFISILEYASKVLPENGEYRAETQLNIPFARCGLSKRKAPYYAYSMPYRTIFRVR